jgi:hypothetical protein
VVARCAVGLSPHLEDDQKSPRFRPWFDSPSARRYDRGSMTRRSTASRIVLLVVATCFLSLALVSGAHVHDRATAGTVKTECQLCSLGSVRADLRHSAPVVVALILVAWCIGLAPTLPGPRRTPTVSVPRGPPAL